MSVVEAAFNESYATRAIYLDDIPVGFFMWVEETASKISIWHFMVDRKHQQKGIGRIALNAVLDEIRQMPSI
ncbi:GNAT family N-acetyltransferase [Shewanella surugensis]|uniref:GNAT family N-acetyltransferase n=1 Tax=Shewanella surugensis TaxID=212020 RepID=A0ABT0L6Q0_9GAMM|nr:GNAT family N-acetyltransferase [Shewanella surugensis]MCL1123368.1 GNAT family N-acetyltransferase [Shewanella surugensis]